MRKRNIAEYITERKTIEEQEQAMKQIARNSYLNEKRLGVLSYFLTNFYQRASLTEIESFGKKIGLESRATYKALANLEREGLVKGKRKGVETPWIFELTGLGRKIGNAFKKELILQDKNNPDSAEGNYEMEKIASI